MNQSTVNQATAIAQAQQEAQRARQGQVNQNPQILIKVHGGAGYKDRQVVVYKLQQVAGYKVSLFFEPRKWLFIRSHFLHFTRSIFLIFEVLLCVSRNYK